MTALGEICNKRGIVVLVDEIFGDLVTNGNRYPPFRTFENRKIVRVVATGHNLDVNTLGMIAAMATYTRGKHWLQQAVSHTNAHGTYLAWLDVTRVMKRSAPGNWPRRGRLHADEHRDV